VVDVLKLLLAFKFAGWILGAKDALWALVAAQQAMNMALIPMFLAALPFILLAGAIAATIVYADELRDAFVDLLEVITDNPALQFLLGIVSPGAAAALSGLPELPKYEKLSPADVVKAGFGHPYISAAPQAQGGGGATSIKVDAPVSVEVGGTTASPEEVGTAVKVAVADAIDGALAQAQAELPGD